MRLSPRAALLARVAAVAVGVVLWADLFVRVIRPALSAPHFPTSAYWVAPRLVLEGRGELLYDAAAFPGAAEQLGAFRDGWISNPPPNLLPLLPLGALPESLAYPLWTVASLAALLSGVALLTRMLRLPPTAALVLVAALPLLHPLRANFAAGQIYAYVTLLLAIVAWALTRRRSGAGVAIAAAVVLKAYFGVVMLAVAVAQRQWRSVAVAGAAIGGAALVATPLVGGAGAWSAWLAYGTELRTAPQTTLTAYQTLNSLFGHLFRFDPTWNPGPVANLPWLADVLWLAAAAAVGLVTAVVVSRHAAGTAGGLKTVALAIPAALLVAPIAEDAHYVTVAIPLVVASVALWRRELRPRWVALAFVVSIALLVPAWPFNRPGVGGWSALLFYPRVYGALALWLVVLWLARRPTESATR